jgi:hypothetical protein
MNANIEVPVRRHGMVNGGKAKKIRHKTREKREARREKWVKKNGHGPRHQLEFERE